MKISFSAPLCSLLLLLLLLGSPLAAAPKADINGYAGMKWGSSLSDLQERKQLVLTKENDGQGSALYALEGEPLRFGKATLTGITCTFAKERLIGVLLLFAGEKNFTAAKTEALSRFGQAAPITQGNDQMFSWAQTNTSIVLSYNRKSQSGFLFLKPRKPLPPVKAAAKKPAPPPAATPPSARRPEPPSRVPTNPQDEETALDRASMPPPQAEQAPRDRTAWSRAQVPQTGAYPGQVPQTGGYPDQVPQTGGYPDQVPQTEPLPRTADQAPSPEIQALIERDQYLTRQCWETTGPQADAACREMQSNIEQLKSMGMCLQADTANQAGHEVSWIRCSSSGIAVDPSATQPTGPSAPQTTGPSAPQPTVDRESLCRRVRDLFGAAAQLRDDGVPSSSAENELLWNRPGGQDPALNEELVRETVNLVYFDQEYSHYSQQENQTQAFERCMSNQGPYSRPLP